MEASGFLNYVSHLYSFFLNKNKQKLIITSLCYLYVWLFYLTKNFDSQVGNDEKCGSLQLLELQKNIKNLCRFFSKTNFILFHYIILCTNLYLRTCIRTYFITNVVTYLDVFDWIFRFDLLTHPSMIFLILAFITSSFNLYVFIINFVALALSLVDYQLYGRGPSFLSHYNATTSYIITKNKKRQFNN